MNFPDLPFRRDGFLNREYHISVYLSIILFMINRHLHSTVFMI